MLKNKTSQHFYCPPGTFLVPQVPRHGDLHHYGLVHGVPRLGGRHGRHLVQDVHGRVAQPGGRGEKRVLFKKYIPCQCSLSILGTLAGCKLDCTMGD